MSGDLIVTNERVDRWVRFTELTDSARAPGWFEAVCACEAQTTGSSPVVEEWAYEHIDRAHPIANPATTKHPVVSGYCPACGVPTLVLSYTQVVCDNRDCTDRLAMFRLMTQCEEIRHQVSINEDRTYVVKHPLIERVDDTLFTCTALEDVRGLVSRYEPGVYWINDTVLEVLDAADR